MSRVHSRLMDRKILERQDARTGNLREDQGMGSGVDDTRGGVKLPS